VLCYSSMKWLGADPATGDSESPSSGMLGNGHHAPSPQMLRHPQVREHVYPTSTTEVIKTSIFKILTRYNLQTMPFKVVFSMKLF
jgi:hypothetical protein